MYVRMDGWVGGRRYVCMCVYVCLHVCLCMHVCVCGCMYVCASGQVRMYACMYASVYPQLACMCMRVYLCMYVRMCASGHVRMYACLRFFPPLRCDTSPCTRVCIHIRICIHVFRDVNPPSLCSIPPPNTCTCVRIRRRTCSRQAVAWMKQHPILRIVMHDQVHTTAVFASLSHGPTPTFTDCRKDVNIFVFLPSFLYSSFRLYYGWLDLRNVDGTATRTCK
jgi:hypothetical protein